jgi:hypothetical protein
VTSQRDKYTIATNAQRCRLDILRNRYVAIQFWALKKPIETKVAILRLSAVVAGGIALLARLIFKLVLQ